MTTAGAGVVILAIMGVMMPGVITGGHQEGPLSEVVHVRHFDQERGYDAGRGGASARSASAVTAGSRLSGMAAARSRRADSTDSSSQAAASGSAAGLMPPWDWAWRIRSAR
jgi:hypothetical protein